MKIIREEKILRLPVELERRFLEIVYVIIIDSWELPVGYQWIELLNFLRAFTADSQLYDEDNSLKDCFKFFTKASQLFKFEDELITQYNQSLLTIQANYHSMMNMMVTDSSTMPFMIIPASQLSTIKNFR